MRKNANVAEENDRKNFYTVRKIWIPKLLEIYGHNNKTGSSRNKAKKNMRHHVVSNLHIRSGHAKIAPKYRCAYDYHRKGEILSKIHVPDEKLS